MYASEPKTLHTNRKHILIFIFSSLCILIGQFGSVWLVSLDSLLLSCDKQPEIDCILKAWESYIYA